MLLVDIQNDLKVALLSRIEVKVATLRLLLSEIKNAEIERGGELGEKDIISIIQREVKKRVEAAQGFRLGNREDKASSEEAELAVLQGYLPEQLSIEELTKLVDRAINELGVTSLADFGKVMTVVMGKVAGRADGKVAGALVKEKLS